ncbi:DUF433 domain-containing protein [Methylomonas sp. CM2]|uniref:DUF433 domain-containing protein n=1 Tax=Methylomonas sp. CM2 TaxID=3417647 RepID=UPI003CF6805E
MNSQYSNHLAAARVSATAKIPLPYGDLIQFRDRDVGHDFADRMTVKPLPCGGTLRIRAMRIRVSAILPMLGEGVSNEEILQDFPDLEHQDTQACLLYAAKRVDFERLAA